MSENRNRKMKHMSDITTIVIPLTLKMGTVPVFVHLDSVIRSNLALFHSVVSMIHICI